MGVDWYSIYLYSAHGILVSWKDVLEYLNIEPPGVERDEDGLKIRFPTSEVRAALKQHQSRLFANFNVYTVGNSFLLFSPEALRKHDNGLDLVGSYNNTQQVSINMLPPEEARDYGEEALIQLAKELSSENKLKFVPGLVSIASSTHRFSLRLMFRKCSGSSTTLELLDARIPTNVSFQIGAETLYHNRAILENFGLAHLLEVPNNLRDDDGTIQVNLTEATPPFSMDMLKELILKYTTRCRPTSGNKMSEEEESQEKKRGIDNSSDYKDSECEDVDIEDVNGTESSTTMDLGSTIEDVNTDGFEVTPRCFLALDAETIQANRDTASVSNDCQFLVGPDKEVVESNRAVLAHSNEVLANMLYGTDLIQVDPATPIEWTEFDPEAVSLAFAAIAGKNPTVPNGKESSFHDVLDFLGESKRTVSAIYKVFEEAEDSVCLDYDGKTNEWMVGEDGDY